MKIKEKLYNEYMSSRKALITSNYNECVLHINNMITQLNQINVLKELDLELIVKGIEDNNFEDVLYKLRKMIEIDGI